MANARTAVEVDIHVGARLRLRRTQLGISQERLADAIGLTFQQLQKYEKGTNRIPASRLWAIANALNVTIDYFYLGATEEMVHDTGGIMYLLADADGTQFAAAYASISSESMRSEILSFVQALAAQRKSALH